MKKWLLRIVGFLVVVVVILVAGSFLISPQVHIERSIVIDAPADVVFAEINDLKRNERWEPWNKEMDPTVKHEYGKQTAGEGAERTWIGDKMGEGRQKITLSKPNERVESDLWFMGSKEASQAAMILSTNGDQTEVLWTFDGNMGNNPINRYMSLFMDSTFLGPQYDQGLAKLKEVVEEEFKNVPPEDAEAIAALQAASIKVTFDKAGKRVIEVDFSGTNCGDAETVHLAKLPNIERLNISVPGVTDAGLVNLIALKKLTKLELNASAVSDEGMQHLVELPKLETLSMQRTNISAPGFEHICKIPSIKRLIMSRTNLNDAALAHLSNCPKLAQLDLLDVTGLTAAGMKHVGELKELRDLKIWGNSIDDPAIMELKGLTKLTNLGLQDTGISKKSIAALADMQALQSIDMFRAVSVNDECLQVFADKEKLRVLELRGTSVTGRGLESLKNLKALRKLDLSETIVSDEGLEHLSGLTDLVDLNLWLCNVTDAGVEKLKPLTKLQRLNLDKTQLTDAGCAHLLSFKELVFLHIGSTKVGDAGIATLEGLKECKNLKDLKITFLPDVSNAAVEKLKAALPGVEVES